MHRARGCESTLAWEWMWSLGLASDDRGCYYRMWITSTVTLKSLNNVDTRQVCGGLNFERKGSGRGRRAIDTLYRLA